MNEIPARVEVVVGRLVEVRVDGAIRTLGDVADFGRRLTDVLSAQRRVVVCADYRCSPVLAPECADAWARLTIGVTPKLERSALLLARTNATLNLQLGRVLSAAKHPARRMFYDAVELQLWLSDVLDGPERDRLDIFLDTT